MSAAEARPGPAPVALKRAREWVRYALADGPVPVGQFNLRAAAIGIAPRTLRRARAAEGVRAYVDRGTWLVTLQTIEPPQTED